MGPRDAQTEAQAQPVAVAAVRHPHIAVRRAGCRGGSSLVGDQALIDRMFDEVPDTSGAVCAPGRPGAVYRPPHVGRRRLRSRRRRYLDDPRRSPRRIADHPWPSCTDAGQRRRSRRRAQRSAGEGGADCWRFESCSRATATSRRRRADLGALGRHRSCRRAARRLGFRRRNALPFVRRSVRPGMMMFPAGGHYDVVSRSSGWRWAAGLRPQHRADPQLRRRTASSPTTRSTASVAPTSATSWSSRSPSRTRRSCASSRTTARPRRS